MAEHLMNDSCPENIVICVDCEDRYKVKDKNNHSCISFLKKIIK